MRQSECPNLSLSQLRQLLSMYTADEDEEKLPLDWLNKLFQQTKTSGLLTLLLQAPNANLIRSNHLEMEAPTIDTSFVTPLVVAELHYIVLEDVMSLPFPPHIKKRLEEMEVEKKARKEHKQMEIGGGGSGNNLRQKESKYHSIFGTNK